MKGREEREEKGRRARTGLRESTMVGGAVNLEGLFVKGRRPTSGEEWSSAMEEMTAKYGDTYAQKCYNETRDFIH